MNLEMFANRYGILALAACALYVLYLVYYFRKAREEDARVRQLERELLVANGDRFHLAQALKRANEDFQELTVKHIQTMNENGEMRFKVEQLEEAAAAARKEAAGTERERRGWHRAANA